MKDPAVDPGGAVEVGNWVCRECGTVNGTTDGECNYCEVRRGKRTVVDVAATLFMVLVVVSVGLGIAIPLLSTGN